MDFCPICDNMLYIAKDEDGQAQRLVYLCKNCGHQEEAPQKTKLISVTNFDNDEFIFTQFINENMLHDPTLPHVDNITCPNKECSKKAEQPNDVIFIKYDVKNMKFIYTCVYCQKHWR